MIAMLRGRLLEVVGERAVVDVQGVGYEVFVSQNTAQSLMGQETVRLFIHTHVREESLSLFGFSSLQEKDLFLNLNKISGIGPKVALTMLSATPVAKLVELIEQGDVRGLSSLPKIGKKKAEQIVLALKGQLTFLDDKPSAVSFTAQADVISALVNLGFRAADVEKIVGEMPPETDFATGVRLGLQQLALQN